MNRTIKSQRILMHVLFWLCYFLLDVIKLSFHKDLDIPKSIVFNICALCIQIGFTYFTAYLIIPLFFEKKQRLLGTTLFIIGLYLFAVANRIMIVHVAEEITAEGPFPQETIYEILTQIDMLFIRYIPSNLGVATIFIAIKYLAERERNIKYELKLAKERSANDLKMLKAQLNPHFLFNTLNNIYSMSISQSPHTSESIAKLSDILDYALYRTDDSMVSVSSELTLIRKYIELEQIRYGDRLTLQIDEQIEKENKIPPLIVLSLVENAFKHGAGKDSGSPLIEIATVSKSGYFQFFISNSITPLQTEEIKASIGLQNIKKQLELIYQDDYRLTIEKNNERFNVNLEITSDAL